MEYPTRNMFARVPKPKFLPPKMITKMSRTVLKSACQFPMLMPRRVEMVWFNKVHGSVPRSTRSSHESAKPIRMTAAMTRIRRVQKCQKIHNKLTGGKEKILLEYDRDVGYDSYLTELAKKRQKDLKYSTTTVGPHRDDISFIVNGIDIRKYGSQGQQRTAALSLKLAQIQLMREVMKESPILLLDDVLSELDSNRKTYLLESIKDTQTIITCTGLDEFISKHLPIQRMFQIKAGKIVKEN